MFFVYSLFFSLGVLLTAPYYLWRLRGKTFSAADWRERFGFLPQRFDQPSRQPTDSGTIWVHAVSVGETLAVAPLVQELQKRYPKRRLFLSHVTPAGRRAGESRLPGVSGQFYLPLDWNWSVRRAIKRIRPALLLLVETELWPNLLRAAHDFGSRVVLVNARLSDRSFRGYRRMRFFMRRVLENVDWVGAQTSRDAERFLFLGAKADRVVVTGNLKFDGKPPTSAELGNRLGRSFEARQRTPVMVAASTMPGEEPLLLQAWEEVQRRYPRALLILAPRHPARFDEVARLLAGAKKEFVRRTALTAEGGGLAGQFVSAGILLLDTIGELGGILELADVVFVGGSLVRAGGHNLLEPAYWGKPILFGPHMDNFRNMSELFLAAGAAVKVNNPSELAHETLDILADSGRGRLLGEAAKCVLERESGATRHTLDRLQEWLDVGTPVRAGVL